jgi:ubiquinone/menaquinone biosynthesis C-methylase UbiE
MEKPDVNILRQLFALMALKPGERVLHLNCGDGWATRMAAQAVSGATGMAAGLDISQDRIAQARADARDVDNVLFAVGAAEEIPWRDEFFDGVFALEGHLDSANLETMLRETHRVLVSGGRLCFLAGCGEESLLRQLLQAGGFQEIANAGLSASQGGLVWMASKP